VGYDLNAFVGLMNGNLMSARRYQYDEENRLTAVTDIDGNELLTIEYDALGRRIASTEYDVATDPCTGDPGPVTVQTRHIYSGLNTVAEYISCDDGTNWDLGREFLWGNRFPEPLVMIDYTAQGVLDVNEEEVLHYVHDALGSVVGLLDAGDPEASPDPIPAKMVERYDCDPYGKTYIDVWDGGAETWVRTTASAYGNPFGWTGQRYDAGVGMYHFAFRSYSPELGRWMQRDPLGYVDGVNLYQYALCSPLAFVDPLGRFGRPRPQPRPYTTGHKVLDLGEGYTGYVDGTGAATHMHVAEPGGGEVARVNSRGIYDAGHGGEPLRRPSELPGGVRTNVRAAFRNVMKGFITPGSALLLILLNTPEAGAAEDEDIQRGRELGWLLEELLGSPEGEEMTRHDASPFVDEAEGEGLWMIPLADGGYLAVWNAFVRHLLRWDALRAFWAWVEDFGHDYESSTPEDVERGFYEWLYQIWWIIDPDLLPRPDLPEGPVVPDRAEICCASVDRHIQFV
jgi:RHS repeat-associated protein